MHDVRLPACWSEWVITEKVGEGSYGVVFKAKNSENGQISAVKVIKVPSDNSERDALIRDLQGHQDTYRTYLQDLTEAYASEIRVMESLRNETNIVSIYDHVIEEGDSDDCWTIFIRMEFLQSFREYAEINEITERTVIQLGIDLCDALIGCDKHHIIHRDIKPDNIFVTANGTFKLGDFGMARMLERSYGSYSTKGTFSYMSPEVFHGEKYGKTADIYSLGMVMYRLLNHGRDAFVDTKKQVVYYRDREEALQKRMGGELLPPPVDASASFAKVLLRACAYDPQVRYQDAFMLRLALQALKEPKSLSKKDEKLLRDDEEKAKKLSSILVQIPDTSETVTVETFRKEKHGAWSLFHSRKRMITCIICVFLICSSVLLWRSKLEKSKDTVGGLPAIEESVGQEKTMKDAMWAADQIATVLGNYSLGDDIDEFSGWFRNASQEQIESYFRDFPGFNAYEERNIIPVEEYDGIFYISIVGYHEGLITSEEDKSRFRRTGALPTLPIGLCLSCENEEWKIDLDSEKLEQLDKLLQENTLPSGYKQAKEAGIKNVRIAAPFNYMYYDRNQTYKGTAAWQVKFIWQDEDANLYIAVLFANGTDQAVTFKNAHIRIYDPSGSSSSDMDIVETDLPVDERVETKTNILKTFMIPSGSFNDFEWGDNINNPMSCEVYYDSGEQV